MFRYILTVLLATAYSGSLGFPAKENNDVLISDLLTSLSERCKNVFLSQQIKSQVESCKVAAPPFKEQQYMCMMFYDINTQLCNAVSESKLIISSDNGNFSNKMEETFNVETACLQSKDWIPSDLQEFPGYKVQVTKILKTRAPCLRVCGDEDVNSLNTNFYCRYFRWGLGVLNNPSLKDPHVSNQEENVQTQSSTQTVHQKSIKDKGQPDSQPVHTVLNKPVDLPLATSNNNDPSSFEASNKSSLETKKQLGNGNKVLSIPSVQDNSANQEVNEPSPSAQVQDGLLKSNESIKDSVHEPINLVVPNQNENHKGIDKPSTDNEEPSKTEEDKILDPKEAVVPNLTNQQDPDYPPSDPESEDREEDGDDEAPAGEVASKFDIPPLENGHPRKVDTAPNGDKDDDIEIPIDWNVKHETSSEVKMTKRVTNKNNYYTATLEEDDDHFFSYFLTAVIMVVFLYVLYHNKSKVSKMVLGLIVEGRQPGRRRNSRGHAYKRLDTLEQAMSTNSAAPPSKIIY